MARKSVRLTDVAYGPSGRRARDVPPPAEATDPLLERELGGRRRVRTGRRGRPRKVDYGFGRSTTVALPPEAAAAMAAANVAYVMRNYVEASAQLMEVVRLCPRAIEAYCTLGMVHEEQGRLDAAMNYYTIALQVGYKHLWRDPDLLSRLARLALLLLINELAAQARVPESNASSAFGQQAEAPSILSAAAFSISEELDLEPAAANGRPSDGMPPAVQSPAERLYRRRRDAVQYLGRLARVLKDPAMYWTRARIQAEGGHARHAMDGLAMLMPALFIPNAPEPPAAAVQDAVLASIGRIAVLGRRLELGHAVAEVVASGMARVVQGQRSAGRTALLLACPAALAEALWRMVEGGLCARAVDLVGALAARVAEDASVGADWFVLGPEERRVRVLSDLPPDVRVLGLAAAVMVGPAEAADVVDAAVYAALRTAPLDAAAVAASTKRSAVLLGRALLYARGDPAAALNVLLPLLARDADGAVDEDVEASILVAHAYRALAMGGVARPAAAPLDDAARRHMLAAQMTLEAVLAVTPGRQDARTALCAVNAALGLALPAEQPPAERSPTASLFVHFAPLPYEAPAAQGTPDAAAGSVDTDALFADVWTWPTTVPPEMLPLDRRLFTGVLGVRFRPGAAMGVQGLDDADDAEDPEAHAQQERATRRRIVKRRRVARPVAVGASAAARDAMHALLERATGAHRTPTDDALYAALQHLGRDDAEAIAMLAQEVLRFAPPHDALAAVAQLPADAAVAGLSRHQWHCAVVCLARGLQLAGRHAEAAEALWRHVFAPGDVGARLFADTDARHTLLRLLHLSSALASLRSAGAIAATFCDDTPLIEGPTDIADDEDASLQSTPRAGQQALASVRWLVRFASDKVVAAEAVVAALRDAMPRSVSAGDVFLRFLRRTVADACALPDRPQRRVRGKALPPAENDGNSSERRGQVALQYALLATYMHAERPEPAATLGSEILARLGPTGGEDPVAAAAIRTCVAAARLQMSLRRKEADPDALRLDALRLLWDGVERGDDDFCDETAATALYNHGRAAHALGQLGLAAQCYRRVIAGAATPAAPAAYNLALVLLHGNEPAAARDALLAHIVW